MNRSAERAPAYFDRSAVSDKAATNLPSPGPQPRAGADGRRHYVGLFDSLEAASAAYDEAALRLHGEFARPNSTQAVTYSPWSVRRDGGFRSTYP